MHMLGASPPDPGAPRAELGHGASPNMPDFRFCKLQNRRRKCRVLSELWSQKKKVFTKILTIFPVESVFLILHFGRHANGGGGGAMAPLPGYATG